MVGLTGEDCLVAVLPPFDDVDVLSDHTYSVDNDDNRIFEKNVETLLFRLFSSTWRNNGFHFLWES